MSPDTGNELIQAEAAAWLARLRSDSVRPQDQAGFQAWLAADARHAAAFEAVTATWDLVGGLKIPRPMRAVEQPSPNRRGVLLMSACVAAAIGAGALYWRDQPPEIYATGHGEQRRLLLADGSRIVLDTDTQIAVKLGSDRREIALARGRAYFEVSPNPHRPFAVTAGGHEIVALGTAFEARLDGGAVTATLEHGRIAVAADGTNSRDYLLAPGDRIAFLPGGAVRRDRPDMTLALAWRQGRLGFDREPLAQAVAEMNRYASQPLVIDDPAIARLAISGIYTAGDNEAFANSISMLLPVKAEIEPSRIRLIGARKVRRPG